MDLRRLAIVLVLALEILAGKDCNSKLSTCIQIVQPFLHLHHYMFPVNITDIQNVCKRWSELMECVRIFMKDCSTDERKSKFNDAVRIPVHLVHAICSSEKYQTDYLEIAECFKEVSINHCGTFYQKMIDKAANTESEYEDICCGYTQFQKCVSGPLHVKCGSHAHSMMNKFLAFLVSQCSKIANSANEVCSAAAPTARSVQSTDSSTAREARHLPTRTWATRTIIYPLEPTSQSRRSSAQTLESPLLLVILFSWTNVYHITHWFRKD